MCQRYIVMMLALAQIANIHAREDRASHVCARSRRSIATPITQTAIWDGTHDYGMNQGQFAQKTKLNSTGLNANWKVSDALSLELDAHSSKSKTSPDSPYGTYAILDLALFNQGNTTGYYDQKLPISGSSA